jgi:hypothetical protein
MPNFFFGWSKFSLTFCPGWPWTTFLLSSAYYVAGIIAMSHCPWPFHLPLSRATYSFFIEGSGFWGWCCRQGALSVLSPGQLVFPAASTVLHAAERLEPLSSSTTHYCCQQRQDLHYSGLVDHRPN